MKAKVICAMCALFLISAAARAETFDVLGQSVPIGVVFSGQIAVDPTTGTLISADIVVPGLVVPGLLPFNVISTMGGIPPNYFLITLKNPTGFMQIIFTTRLQGYTPAGELGGTLIGFTGATISLVYIGFYPEGIFVDLTAPDLLGTISPTPLPGALPLFAAGLGALGLLGWLRKRKSHLTVFC